MKKAAYMDKVTREMIEAEGEPVINWIWKLCNMGFESNVVPGVL